MQMPVGTHNVLRPGTRRSALRREHLIHPTSRCRSGSNPVEPRLGLTAQSRLTLNLQSGPTSPKGCLAWHGPGSYSHGYRRLILHVTTERAPS